MTKNKQFGRRKMKLDLEDGTSDLGKLFQKLWKNTLKSNLYAKDKAEILRLLIFAFTIITIVAMFVLKGLTSSTCPNRRC